MPWPTKVFCLAIDKGRIVALLPWQEAKQRFAPRVVHERPDHVLLPGLVNAHTHAAMTLMRGFADDLPLERWLNERIWPAETRFASPEFVTDGVRLAVAEMLRGGITCFADMYFFPQCTARVAAEAGIRLVVGMIALEIPSPWAATAAEYIRKGLAVHDSYRTHPLVTTMFAPHAPYKRWRRHPEANPPTRGSTGRPGADARPRDRGRGRRSRGGDRAAALAASRRTRTAESGADGRARHPAYGRGNRRARPGRL